MPFFAFFPFSKNAPTAAAASREKEKSLLLALCGDKVKQFWRVFDLQCLANSFQNLGRQPQRLRRERGPLAFCFRFLAERSCALQRKDASVLDISDAKGFAFKSQRKCRIPFEFASLRVCQVEGGVVGPRGGAGGSAGSPASDCKAPANLFS